MKSFKFMALVAMCAASLGASAQDTTGSVLWTSSPQAKPQSDGWSTLWVEYNPSNYKSDKKSEDDQSVTGISVGYSQAFAVAPGSPIYLEAGVGLQYSFFNEDGKIMLSYSDDYYYGSETFDGEKKFSMFSAKIPVNLMYKFELPNSSISLMPFVGANLRYNFSAKMKYTPDDDDWDYLFDYYDIDDEQDLFDKKDMGSSKNTWKRLQLGWNVGVKARLGENFVVGVSYGQDFSEIAKKLKISTTTISLGYTF